jgi:hypothetical protein
MLLSMEVMDAHSHDSIDLSSSRRSSHLAIVVMECVFFVATNIEPPCAFPHVFVYCVTVSVVATLGIIKVAAIASSMVHGGTRNVAVQRTYMTCTTVTLHAANRITMA